MTQAVIFDMDGVLVDSGPPHAESWRVVARQHDIDISDDLFARLFGRPSRDIVRIIWGEDLSDEEVARLDDEKERAYRDLVRGRVPLMPAARETLPALHEAGLLLAVATSGPPENLALVLDEGGLREFISATVTGFDVQHGKPAPDCFLLAAQRLGVPADVCVVVEDAPVGVQAAVAAGMPAIGLVGTHPAEPLQQAGAVRTIERLDALTPQLVAQLLRPAG